MAERVDDGRRRACSRATLPKNFLPISVSRSVLCNAAMNGRASAGCFVTCSPRREMFINTTPRTSSGASTASCSPATPPTELQKTNAGPPTT